MSRNILITGATGFIGRHFLNAVINDNSYEKIFSFQHKGGSPLQNLSHTSHSDFRMIAGDISNKNSINYLEEKLKDTKIHSVVHLAASMQMYAGNNEIDSVNVAGAVNIAQIALKFGAERFVFAGSVETGVPVSDEDDPGDEEIPPKPVNRYGLSKLKAEEKITQLMKKNPQTKFYLLRISNAYGPGSSFF